MAVASVTFDGTRVDHADALSPTPGSWTDLGGKSAALEPDVVWQRASGTDGAVSEKVGTSEGGVSFEHTAATIDYTSGPKVWIAKHTATNYSALNVKGATGGILEMGSGGQRVDYDRYYVVGGDTYPAKGGWLITPIDPNGGNQSAQPGTAPTLTAINYYGWACDFTATSKIENVIMDAIDHINNGTGLTLIGGDGASADGLFQDFIDFDEGTFANRYGIVTSQDGVLFVTGVITIGTATETDFTDSAAVIVFPEAEFLNTVGFFGIDFGIQNASSVIDISACTFKSEGTVAGSVDTRPDYEVIGTSGSLVIANTVFDTYRNITMNAQCELANCLFLAGALVDAGSGADLNGSTILLPTTAADVGALLWDVALDPDGELNDMTINSGAAAHHAIDFGTLVDSSLTSITLRGINFNGFGAVDDADASTVRFLATTGSLTLNLIDCTVDGVSPVASGGGQNFSVDDAAGMTVTVVVSPVTLQITVKDKLSLVVIENVQTSIHLKDSPFTELMNEDTDVSGIASESYAGATPVDVVWKCRKSDDLDDPRYRGGSSIETITSNGLEITVLLEENPVLN